MEKFKYNNINEYSGMDIEEIYEPQINENVEELLNEYTCFKLMFTNEILEFFVKESNIYYEKFLKEKFGDNYKEIIFTKNSYNTYPYLYITKGIKKEDIIAFIGIRIFMGLHKCPTIECYWNNSYLYNNMLNNIMPKNYFFLLSKCLYFPEKEEENSSGGHTDDPHHKIKFFLEKLSKNFQKHYTLGKN